uniref:Uncharacterized protein n=1 Tax=Globodera rostochiensis TaxID=31243 RepID=A0A914GS97_GLORO
MMITSPPPHPDSSIFSIHPSHATRVRSSWRSDNNDNVDKDRRQQQLTVFAGDELARTSPEAFCQFKQRKGTEFALFRRNNEQQQERKRAGELL